MPARNDAALDFLMTRRSVPAKTLTAPGPNRSEAENLLTAAARTPDHGKLEPWRFVALERPAIERMIGQIEACGARLGKSEEDITKALAHYRNAPLAVAVVESPVASEKIPVSEQSYSTGAVCLALLNASLASGWGANWLSGWFSHDPEFCRIAFDLAEYERVAGIIVIGTAKSAPPDRPRPDVSLKTIWIS